MDEKVFPVLERRTARTTVCARSSTLLVYIGVCGSWIHWYIFGGYVSVRERGKSIVGQASEKWERGRLRKYLCSVLRSGTAAGCCPWQTLPISYRSIDY